MKNSLFLYSFVLLLAASCTKESVFGGPDFYEDDFEGYTLSDSLVDGDDERWSFFQITNNSNTIDLDTSVVHSGDQSLKFDAVDGGDQLSKCSVVKQFMAFLEGSTVLLEAWYYVESSSSTDWLWLMDFEEKTAIGAGPGLRLAIFEDALILNYKLEGGENTKQPEETKVDFPLDQWVHVEMEVLLSQKKDGWIKIYQDSELLIHDTDVRTLPVDKLYHTQGTKGQYSQIEFGITANGTGADQILYLDDVKAEVIN